MAASSHKPITLTYQIGGHWLSHLDIVTMFMNKAGDVRLACADAWAWEAPPVWVWGTATHDLNHDWPVGERPFEEAFDFSKKPDKIYNVIWPLFLAWEEYVLNFAKHSDAEMAYQAALEFLGQYCVKNGKKYVPAFQAWANKACSPYSSVWYTRTLEAIYVVCDRFGTFTNPGIYRERVQQVKSLANSLGLSLKLPDSVVRAARMTAELDVPVPIASSGPGT
jgi:hypothetical protein